LGRISGIEDVSGNDHGIDVMPANGVDEKGEEATMFLMARQIAERLAEVPIRGVQDAEIAGQLGRDLIEQVDALTSAEMGIAQVN
jgi:hypothetical protein